MKTVHVNASRAYDVRIGQGLLRDCGGAVRSVTEASAAFIVSDENVFVPYGRTVMESLQGAGFLVDHYVFRHGEQSKNLKTWGSILEAMCTAQLTRTDVVVALGGGVPGDMGGFAAAAYQRGVDFVQLPTTLLAAVDSSVGGKTAIDLEGGKNLAGAFHQPLLVLCDTDTFRTLPDRELTSGFAEVIKYAVLEEGLFSALDPVPSGEALEDVIARCVSIKNDYVSADEFDRDCRALLNLGHTVGHAAEACSGYSLLHGEAVAMGLSAIARASAVRGICSSETADCIIALLHKYGLPTEIPFSASELRREMLRDKKRSGNTLKLIVPEAIGRCRTETVPVGDLESWLRDGGVS